MEIFKLFGTIALKGIEAAKEDIDAVSEKAQSLGSKLESAGSKVASFGGNLTAKLSAPITELGGYAVKSAADVKAMNSQFEQTFGEMQTQASQAMQGVATSSGILESRLQGIGTSIYAFAKSSGADSAEALALMETALQATADGAAYYDRSLEDTAESLQSFLKGNFANDAALGVSCTETTRNAKAMELFGQKYNDLSEIQKQQTLLKMVTDSQQLSGAMGQAARESDGFENVMGNLKESGKLLAAEFGEVLLPTVIDLIKQATEFMSKLNGMDEGTKKMIITVAGIAVAVGPVLSTVGKVTTGIGSVIKVGGSLIGGINKLSPVLKGLTTSGGTLLGGIAKIGSKITGFLIPAITSISPIVLVVIGVVAALVAGGVALYKNWDEVSAWAKKAWGNIKKTVGDAIDGVLGFFKNVISFIGDNWQGLLMMLVNPFVGGFKLLYDNCEGFKQFIDGFLSNIKQGFTNFVSNISQGASNLKENVTTKFNELKTQATTKFSELKTSVVTKFEELKTRSGEKAEEIKTKTVNAFNTLKENGITAFDNLKTMALERFDNLKSGITEKLRTVQDFVSGCVEKLKSFFNFDWNLPRIKLPHFSITGSFSLSPPSIPHIGVEWYKDGGVMTDPTAFGFNPSTGKVMVGGEAGAEAIAPVDVLLGYIRQAVSENNTQLYTVLNAIYLLLAEYLPEFRNQQLVLDTGALVGELAHPMNEELGKITHMRGRRN